jgi:hypothetical protein
MHAWEHEHPAGIIRAYPEPPMQTPQPAAGMRFAADWTPTALATSIDPA